MSDQYIGYQHVSGTIHIKRYYSMSQLDEMQASPYVVAVYGPFFANDYQHALHVLQLRMHGINE